jgi:N-acetylmuramoyl-L-alanine amidase
VIALCVGHSRRLADGTPEGGAITCDGGTSEWEWNAALARLIAAELHDAHGIAAEIVNDYGPRGYGSAMRWLGGTCLRGFPGLRLAVELHFNSADDPAASGHEWLYWPGSIKGKLAATELHLAMCRDFPAIRPRGVKIPPDARGAAFLRETPCPAVIAEPFFGSNPRDWDAARARPEKLAATLAAGLAAALRRM